MERCLTCAHWGFEREADAPEDARACEFIPHIEDVMEWVDDGNGDFRRRAKPEYRSTLAFARDASGYAAHLVTMPDFGCVHHKPMKK